MGSRFAWTEMFATDRAASERFYTALFGWTTKATKVYEHDYIRIVNGDHEIGALLDSQDPQDPAAWVSSLMTDDVDAATDRAREKGANIMMGPEDIGGVGRFSWGTDPQGATFVLGSGNWGTTPPSEDNPTVHGDVVWTELLADDVQVATDFYQHVAGWQTQEMAFNGQGYTIFQQDEGGVAGLQQRPDQFPQTQWLVYFHTDDADATAMKAVDLGGRLLTPIFDVPTVGRIGWVTDPLGAAFAMLTPRPEPG